MFATRSRLLSRPWVVASRRLFTSEIRAGRSNLLSGSRTVRTLPSASGHINTRSLSSAATATYDQSVESFPSIVIGANGSIVPQGSFAETQAQVSCKVHSTPRAPNQDQLLIETVLDPLLVSSLSLPCLFVRTVFGPGSRCRGKPP